MPRSQSTHMRSKRLMRAIANSNAYQLSSRYNGTYNSAWDTLYARKFVRRLWSEEVHDAICQATGVLPASPGYTVGGPLVPLDNVYYAMQLPDTLGGNLEGANTFMNYFMRGNRDSFTLADALSAVL